MIEALKQRIAELERENLLLQIQAGALPSVDVPVECRSGHTAFASGFESGFRGWGDYNPYEHRYHWNVWNTGYRIGKDAARKQHMKALSGTRTDAADAKRPHL